MSITLTTFTPGTKAKADEVNANFSALHDAVNSKALMGGDSSQQFSVASGTSDFNAVNKKQLDDMSSNLTTAIGKSKVKFCVRSGYTKSGEAELFSYSGVVITPKIGTGFANLVIADYAGTQTTISAVSNLSMSGKTDGVYNIFITPKGALYTSKNTIYVQKSRPALSDGDIWLNTSVEPISCIKYDGTNDNEFLDVPLGTVTVSSSAITAVKTFEYNQNGYDINVYSYKGKKFNYANPVGKAAGVGYVAESDGLLFIRHGNTLDTISVTIDGFNYCLGWSSSQGSSSSDFIPVIKGQFYCFYGGDVRYFIPQITV